MDDDTRPDDGGPPTQRMRPEDFDDATGRLPAEDEPTRRVTGGSDAFPTRRFDPATPLPQSHTEILDIPPDPRAGRATGFGVAIVVIALVAAALIGYTTRVPHPPGLLVRALVGPNGASIPFAGSGRLEIQRGALSTATTISIRQVKLNQVVTLKDRNGQVVKEFQPGAVVLYTFEPNTTTFNQPITIRLPVQGDADAALVVASNEVRVISGIRQGDVFVIQTSNFEFR